VRASIIIIVYNGIAYLERCLTSLRQAIGSGGEIILVDNASTDGSADFVQHRYPDVILIRNEVNRGFAAACNQGARRASGQYLVFLNQDTQVLSGWLSGLINALEGNGTVALATSKLLLMSQPDKINACGQDIHYTGLNFSRGFLCPADQFSRPETVGAVAGASFAIRRELWERLGGFDEELFMYYEETDLCWRARLAGYQCLYVPTSVVYHDYRSGEHSFSAWYYSKRNRYILLLKNWRWATLLLLLPGILLAELVDWGHAILVGRQALWAKIHSWRWLAANLSRVIRSRQQVQAQRKVPDWVLLEECVYRLNPREISAGRIGHLLVFLCNVCFWANYMVARAVCRTLGI
jgi:GT2 family glycosyltransferase